MIEALSPLIGVAFGALITGTATGATTYWQMKRRRQERREDQLRNDAELLATVQAFISDLEPLHRVHSSPRDRSIEEERFQAFQKCLEEARHQLFLLSMDYRSPAIRDLARALAEELPDTLRLTKTAVMQLRWDFKAIKYTRPIESLRSAQKQHDWTTALMEELEQATFMAAVGKEFTSVLLVPEENEGAAQKDTDA